MHNDMNITQSDVVSDAEFICLQRLENVLNMKYQDNDLVMKIFKILVA